MTDTEHIQGSARFRRYVPWQGPATRLDLALMGAILGVVGLGLVIRPLKPFLVAEHPVLLEFVSGDLLAIGAGAAFARIGEAPLWLVVVAGAVGMVRFDWLAWWAGRQWGAGIIRIFTASERAQRLAARAAEWNPWSFGSPSSSLSFPVSPRRWCTPRPAGPGCGRPPSSYSTSSARR
jgi:hypothetical protein